MHLIKKQDKPKIINKLGSALPLTGRYPLPQVPGRQHKYPGTVLHLYFNGDRLGNILHLIPYSFKQLLNWL